MSNVFSSSVLASPASTIESLTREFEHSLDNLPSNKNDKTDLSSESKSSSLRSGHSLDIRQVIKGQFVVKAQDTDNSKADGSTHDLDKGDKESTVKSSAQKPTNSPRGSANRSSIGHYSLGPHR